MSSTIQAVLQLTEEIASALASEFKLYLPQIIPHALKIFLYDDSPSKSVTAQVKRKLLMFFKFYISTCVSWSTYSLIESIDSTTYGRWFIFVSWKTLFRL